MGSFHLAVLAACGKVVEEALMKQKAFVCCTGRFRLSDLSASILHSDSIPTPFLPTSICPSPEGHLPRTIFLVGSGEEIQCGVETLQVLDLLFGTIREFRPHTQV